MHVAPHPSIYEAYSAKKRHVDVRVALFVVIAVIVIAEGFGVVYLYKPVAGAMVHRCHFGVKQICEYTEDSRTDYHNPDEFD